MSFAWHYQKRSLGCVFECAFYIFLLLYGPFVVLMAELIELYCDARLYLLWDSISTSGKPFIEQNNNVCSPGDQPHEVVDQHLHDLDLNLDSDPQTLPNIPFTSDGNVGPTKKSHDGGDHSPDPAESMHPAGCMETKECLLSDLHYNPLDTTSSSDCNDSNSDASNASSVSFDSSSTWTSSSSSCCSSVCTKDTENFHFQNILSNPSTNSSSSSTSTSALSEEDAFDEEATPPLMQVKIKYLSLALQILKMLTYQAKMNTKFSTSSSGFLRRIKKFLPHIPKNIFKSFSELRVILTNSAPEDFLFSSFLIPEQLVFARSAENSLAQDTSGDNYLVFLDLVPITHNENDSGSDIDSDEDFLNDPNKPFLGTISNIPFSKEDQAEKEEANDMAVEVSLEAPKWQRKYKSSLRALGYAMSIRHPLIELGSHNLPLCAANPKEFINSIANTCHDWNAIKPSRRRPHLDILSTNFSPFDFRISTPSNSTLQTCFCSLGLSISCGKKSPGIFPWLSNISLLKDCPQFFPPSLNSSECVNQNWIRYTISVVPSSVSSIISPCPHIYSVVAEGDPFFILKNCSFVWNGTCSANLSAKLKTNIELAAVNDSRSSLQVIAYSVVLISDDQLEPLCEDPMLMHGSVSWIVFSSRESGQQISNSCPYQEKLEKILTTNHSFLGMIGLGHKPLPEIPECLEDFSHAGVRFTLYSNENESHTRSLGRRLGLDSDWNSCINLLDEVVDGRFKECPAQNIAHCGAGRPLPVGISCIRNHLRSVDNLPLLVSLFSSSTVKETSQMLSIYWEYNEIPMFWGSSLSGSELLLRDSAALSIIVDPIPRMRISMLNEPSLTTASSSFNLSIVIQRIYSLLAPSLLMKYNMKPYIITQMIREARLLQIHYEMFFSVYAKLLFAFFVSGAVCENQLSIATFCFGVFPALSIVLLFLIDIVPGDTDVMKKLPKRGWTTNLESSDYNEYDPELENVPHYFWSTFKLLKSCVSLVGMLCFCRWKYSHDVALLNCSLFAVTCLCTLFEIGSLKPLGSKISQSLILTLSGWNAALFVIVHFVFGLQFSVNVDILYIIPMSFIWYYLDEDMIHAPRRELEKKLQKLRKLEFNTRLGMHSPI